MRGLSHEDGGEALASNASLSYLVLRGNKRNFGLVQAGKWAGFSFLVVLIRKALAGVITSYLGGGR